MPYFPIEFPKVIHFFPWEKPAEYLISSLSNRKCFFNSG
jgi:hypothetical protein